MKRNILLLLLAFQILFNSKVCSQTINVPYQFYLDANNNCVYNVGETLLYNLPGNVELSYLNTSSVFVTSSTMVTCPNTIAVSNPSVPANNSLTYTYSTVSYPTFLINTSCSSYSNLSYTATNYLPVKTIDQMSDFTFNGAKASLKGNTFPVCFNSGNDSMYINFTINNIYTCNALTASRTYSLFLDGVLYDQLTISAGTGYNTALGSKCSLGEQYMPWYCTLNIRTQLPAGISNLGTHSFAIKTTPIYSSSLAAINYSCTLNSVPCTKVSGRFYNDCNSDCIMNAGDGNIFKGVVAKLYSSGNNLVISPDFLGNFSAFAPNSINQYYLTSYSVLPSFTPCPISTNTVTLPPGITTNSFTFGYKASNYIDNAVISHPPSGITSPGFTCYPRFSIINQLFATCSTTLPTNPGKLKFVLDRKMTYNGPVSPTPVPDAIIPAITGDTIVWNISDFLNLPQSMYAVSATVNSSVTIGSAYTNYAIIQPSIDLLNTNNFSAIALNIGVPYDPNNKLCYAPGIQPNGDIPFGTQELRYTVNFQNIGTAPAMNVITLDTLDANLDWTSLEVLSSSFRVQTQVDNSNGVTFFYFKGINLPDSNSNEPASHGFVNYKIKLKSGVPANTIIKNRAHNYFDYQKPVPTNQTSNKLVVFASIDELNTYDNITLFPNPATNKIYINSEIEIKQVRVINNLGQTVLTQPINSKADVVDVAQLASGVYFISIQLNNQMVVIRKIIKN